MTEGIRYECGRMDCHDAFDTEELRDQHEESAHYRSDEQEPAAIEADFDRIDAELEAEAAAAAERAAKAAVIAETAPVITDEQHTHTTEQLEAAMQAGMDRRSKVATSTTASGSGSSDEAAKPEAQPPSKHYRCGVRMPKDDEACDELYVTAQQRGQHRRHSHPGWGADNLEGPQEVPNIVVTAAPGEPIVFRDDFIRTLAITLGRDAFETLEALAFLRGDTPANTLQLLAQNMLERAAATPVVGELLELRRRRKDPA